MATEIFGWCSSVILFLTISSQVYKQWRTGMGQGVSHWLFIGQLTASAGFTVYSALLGNWVFIVTNALMSVSAMVGLYILVFRCERDEDEGADDAAAREADGGRGRTRLAHKTLRRVLDGA